MTGKELMEKYDRLFERRKLPMSQTCMCWGICCDQGWIPILEELCENILIVEKETGAEFRFEQVKEKFGTLRVYWKGSGSKTANWAFSYLVSQAEYRSSITCEITGKYGSLYSSGGWIRTLSKEKAEELGYKKVDDDF